MNNGKLGINASYFYQDTLSSAARRLAKLGFRKVEFTGLTLKELSAVQFKELTKFLAGEGINCTSINAVTDLVPINLGNLAAFSDKERNNAIAHVKQCLDYACNLQCPVVVCDTGTSTEDFKPYTKQNERYFTALSEILRYAAASSKKVVLLNVPGRRWIPWDGLPPDKNRVVERYVWPWRAWPDEEEVIKKLHAKLKNRVSWALDTANEAVANGVTEYRLEDVIAFYMKHDLEIVYLANHPGPYNKVWHRLLLHQPLWDGFYTARDYRAVLNLLRKKRFQGEIVLQIKEKEPSENSLKRCLKILES